MQIFLHLPHMAEFGVISQLVPHIFEKSVIIILLSVVQLPE